MAASADPAASRARPALGVRFTREQTLLYAGLLVAGALISGFTIFRGGAPFDEGLVLQAARRVAGGQVPYRDFLWPYGPAQPYVLGASFDLLGTSLLGWRLMRVACDAAIALTVFALIRRETTKGPALAGWLATACAMSQPTSATPFPFALLLGLLAFHVATSRPPRPWTLPAAGALIGAAAAWRLDFAIYAGGAVLVALALRKAPLSERVRDLGVFALAGTLVTVLAYLPFVVAVGPADLYDALVGSSLRERDFWTLPFPLSYDGDLRAWPPGDLAKDSKDLVGFYLPVICLVGFAIAAVSAVSAARRGAPVLWSRMGLLVFTAGGVLYLLSRTDEFHVTPLVVLLAVALPLVIAARPARPLAVAAAVALGLLVLHGVANRVSALVAPPRLARIDVAVADGAKAAPGEAAALARMVTTVQGAVPPGGSIYAITRRADLVRFNQPLVYVLTERENPTDRDFGLQTSAAAQRETVAALRRSRPDAIVRWTDPISTVREPNLRGRSSGSRTLDEYVAGAYRPLDRLGEYEVLIPR